MDPGSQETGCAGSYHAKIWREGEFQEADFFFEDGKIKDGIRGALTEIPFVIPPFADPHIHGGWGMSFQQGHFFDLEEKLRDEGVLFAVPTLANDDLDRIGDLVIQFREYKQRRPDSIFPFLRMEGPFISRTKKGAQQGRFILPTDPEAVTRFLTLEEVKVFTFAPEIPDVDRMLHRAFQAGKIPSVGHSNARFHDFMKCYEKGVRHVTHFPNALRGFHHREIGLLGAGLYWDDLNLEVIADGIHTSFEFLLLLLKIKGPCFALISDLIPPAYSSQNAGGEVKVLEGGRKITEKDGTLAGGGTSVPEQAERLYRKGIAPEDLVPLATENALKFYGFAPPDLREDHEATCLFLDSDFRVTEMYIFGKKIGEPGGQRGKSL